MNDEFSPLDWYLRPNTWPRWTPDATLGGEHAPPKVPARIAFDWDETPTGGLIGRPNPLWNQSNSYWWELRSRIPYMVELDRRLGITADYYGTTKAAILKQLIRHGFPLVSLGVTAGVGGMPQLPDRERMQENGD